MFWNWVGKVDHNFGANDRAFFRWGENERNEMRNTTADPQRPRAGRPAAADQRANRALVGDWVHIFGAGTVFNLRGSYTYYLEWSYSEDALGFDATEFWPRKSRRPVAEPGLDGIFPRIEVDSSSAVARPAPNRNRNYSLQPNVSLTRGAHNIRSGLDMRWTNVYNENYNNSRRPRAVQPRLHPQHPEQHRRARGQRLRLVPARRAERRRGGRQPDAALRVVLRRAVDPGRLADQRQLTVNLGFRWDFNGAVSEADNLLNYIFDPTHRQPGVGARRPAR